MKRILLIFAVCIPMFISAQESKLNLLFDKYSGQKGYTTVHITSYMFELFARIDSESEEDFAAATKGMEALKILTLSDENGAPKQEFINELKNALKASVYKDFMIINEDGNEIRFMVRDEGNKITEFVMIVEDPKEPVLLFIEGDIDVANIAKMSKSMEIEGMEHLNKLEEKE